MRIEEHICEAIEYIVNAAIAKAPHDFTTTAFITNCIDQKTGKYTIDYQGSKQYAYALNKDIKFIDGAQVYILVPQGDMSEEKIILAAVNKDSEQSIPQNTDQMEQTFMNLVTFISGEDGNASVEYNEDTGRYDFSGTMGYFQLQEGSYTPSEYTPESHTYDEDEDCLSFYPSEYTAEQVVLPTKAT